MSTYDRPQVIGSRTLPPDPSLVSTIGLHHSLPTAIADLVDNSIDAEATNVLIRMLQRDGRIVGLVVIDDGKGMDDDTIDAAMTYAHKREYESDDLGHFGLGMKAASLSQADTLTVWSRAWGRTAAGRLIDRDKVGTDHSVSVLRSEQATQRLDACRPGFSVETGTIIEWRDVRNFLTSSDEDEQTTWLEQTLNDIRTHLGIVLHRILDAGRVKIMVDVLDLELDQPGVPRSVDPINPFGYPRSGNPAYPRDLRIELPGRSEPLVARAHIWPPRSTQPEFRLRGLPGKAHQGIYFYRHDRLLQIGGWNGLVNTQPDYELGRVAVDIDDDLQRFVTISPEKAGLTLDPTLVGAIETATFADGRGSFQDYLADLQLGSQQARSRQPRPVDIVEPRIGLPADVLDAFDDALEFKADEKPVDIKWRTLAIGTFFDIDRERRQLLLNARYRTALVGQHSLDPQDAPVLKTLLHLLVAELFEGFYHGSRDKRKEEAWQQVLDAALQEQLKQYESRNETSDE